MITGHYRVLYAADDGYLYTVNIDGIDCEDRDEFRFLNQDRQVPWGTVSIMLYPLF